jgi:hypothetical protein
LIGSHSPSPVAFSGPSAWEETALGEEVGGACVAHAAAAGVGVRERGAGDVRQAGLEREADDVRQRDGLRATLT